MQTVRVVVARSHRHSADRIVEVGEILDLPEHVATERMTTGAVRPAPPVEVASPSAAGGTGTADSGVQVGVAPAAPTPGDGPAAQPVAAAEQPAAPADPPAAPLTHTAAEPPAAQPAKPARKSSK